MEVRSDYFSRIKKDIGSFSGGDILIFFSLGHVWDTGHKIQHIYVPIIMEYYILWFFKTLLGSNPVSSTTAGHRHLSMLRRVLTNRDGI